VHAREVHAREVHAHEVHAMRYTPMQWSQFMGRGLEPMGRAGQAFSFRPTL
jgi:hypothetical protein